MRENERTGGEGVRECGGITVLLIYQRFFDIMIRRREHGKTRERENGKAGEKFNAKPQVPTCRESSLLFGSF